MSMNNSTANDLVNPPARQFIYHVPESVLFDDSLTLTDLKIYMIVRSFMDTTKEAFFSNAWAAKKLGVDARTVRRSIAKLVKNGYIGRDDDTDKNYRYLFICLRARVDLDPDDEEVSRRGADKDVRDGGQKCPQREDKNVLQLDQRSITSNKRAKPWIEEQQELRDLHEQLKADDVKISYSKLNQLAKQHGIEYLIAKAELTKKREGVFNRSAYFTSAVSEDFQEVQSKPKQNVEPEVKVFSSDYIVARNRGNKAHQEALAALLTEGVIEPQPDWLTNGTSTLDLKARNKYEFEYSIFEKKLADKILELGGELPE